MTCLLGAVGEVVVAGAHVVVSASGLHLDNAAIEVVALRVIELGAVLGVLVGVAESLKLLEGVAAV